VVPVKLTQPVDLLIFVGAARDGHDLEGRAEHFLACLLTEVPDDVHCQCTVELRLHLNTLSAHAALGLAHASLLRPLHGTALWNAEPVVA
jgi:hypothetical protein